MSYIQQGDLLLKYKVEIPKMLTELNTDLLHKGQNHHHKVRGEFKIFTCKEGDIYLESNGCELFHEEHKTILIPAGSYKKEIVQEYSHFDEESRDVID